MTVRCPVFHLRQSLQEIDRDKNHTKTLKTNDKFQILGKLCNKMGIKDNLKFKIMSVI